MADTSKPQSKAQDDLSIEEILGSIRRIIAEDEEDDAAPVAAAPAVTAETHAMDAAVEDQPVPTIIMEDDPANEEPLELTNRIEPDGAIAVEAVVAMDISMEDEPAEFGMQDQIDMASDDVMLADHQEEPQPEPAPVTEEKPAMTTQDDTLPKDNSLLSSNTAIATAAVMAKLARQAAITEEGNGNVTLEAMVKEMIRPMLREWLDSNLPELVQKMVERELERLTKRL